MSFGIGESYELRNPESWGGLIMHCVACASKLQFRGPPRKTSVPYSWRLWGGRKKTFGRYIALPFPRFVERQVGLACRILAPKRGVTYFLRDDEIHASRLASTSHCGGRSRVRIIGPNRTIRFHSPPQRPFYRPPLKTPLLDLSEVGLC